MTTNEVMRWNGPQQQQEEEEEEEEEEQQSYPITWADRLRLS